MVLSLSYSCFHFGPKYYRPAASDGHCHNRLLRLKMSALTANVGPGRQPDHLRIQLGPINGKHTDKSSIGGRDIAVCAKIQDGGRRHLGFNFCLIFWHTSQKVTENTPPPLHRPSLRRLTSTKLGMRGRILDIFLGFKYH